MLPIARAGVWVHFDEDLLVDYGDVLRYIYRTALSWAYEREAPFPKEEVEEALKSFKNVDYDSFIGLFYLWRFVSTRLSLPIPRLQRIVPSVVSHWNAIKGGSDTITKLLWSNKHDPPSQSTQSRAISRMLMLCAVIVHRLYHICTSKAVEQYPSLRSFRVAASKRCTFHQTCLNLVHAIKHQNFQPRPSSVLTSSALVNQGTRTRRGDTTTRLAEWGATPTGATPHKNVKQWFARDPASLTGLDMETHVRARECTGIPVYRVSPVSKDSKGAGARNSCSECKRLTNIYCIGCRRWFCSPQLPANREDGKDGTDDPRYFKIAHKGINNGKDEEICAVFSCWHKGHQAALDLDGSFARGWRNFDDDVSSMTSF